MNACLRQASLGKRIVAKALDFALANAFFLASLFVAGLFFPAGGPLFGVMALTGLFLTLAYLLFADAWEGRSIGKRFMGLKVVDYLTGAPCTPSASFARNAAGFGLLRVWQVAEEEASMEAGRYRGPVVVDLSKLGTGMAIPAIEPRARIDFEGIAEYARRHRSREQGK